MTIVRRPTGKNDRSAGLIISRMEICCHMPELIKRKCHDPEGHLDEQDLKDIAEAEDDISQGRVYTTEQAKAILAIK